MASAPKDHSKDQADSDGRFRRQIAAFRNTVEKGGKFEPEKGRYRLFICPVCPWAHRTHIMRDLKGLQDIIPITRLYPQLTDKGWRFGKPGEEALGDPDPLYGFSHLREYYLKTDPNYDARYTVPVLWDTKTETIVNNESSELIRILTRAFDELLPKDKASIDVYPEHLRAEIDELNEWVYHTVNNGVYKSGFATTQEAYEENVIPLFDSLKRLEKILSDGREYLVGGQLTEADVRLFTTLIRFDVAYVGKFNCNLGTIRHDFPHLNRWMKNLYWNRPEFRETTNFRGIKEGYYGLDPTKRGKGEGAPIVPVGPVPDIVPL